MFYPHTKLQIIINPQKSLPIIVDFIRILPRYFKPCIEVSCRYSCTSLRTIFIILLSDRTSRDLSRLNNFSLLIFFGISTRFTTILFTVCFFCKIFGIMMQTIRRALGKCALSISFRYFRKVLHVKLLFDVPTMLLLRRIALYCGLDRIMLIFIAR